MFNKLLSGEKKNKYGFFGDYSSWSKVSAIAEEYDKPLVIEKTTPTSLIGKTNYECEPALFHQKETPFSLMAFLMLSVSLKKRALNILDFGGSSGSLYYQLKDFLSSGVCNSWNIVEHEYFTNCGQTNSEDDKLKFYSSIDKCKAEKEIDFVLLSNSVQYLEKPHVFLEKLAGYGFDFIFFDRTTFHKITSDRLTLQVGPQGSCAVAYPVWFFHQDFFLSHFSGLYKIISEFLTCIEEEKNVLIDGKIQGVNKGFYLINASKYA